ncbi:macrolide family glycosyltransferase [Kutzneria sp. CA-103260]|uniref:macrolide family glycosyltransferase n=1 Tax=Kutzneria sp. CA-103260 TaxID=2802641 RepID=UPI001BA61D39|nr:macrolide family glycosyltransferase [Kutzneria sp. CA-103260]QUQ64747.1 UDP glycosyl transferase [Kutzneria sp. CA-103260]
MHIVFVTVPASGHIYPTLPLVQELTRRGHRVSYATSPDYRDVIADSGAELVPVDWYPEKVKASKGGQTTGELADMLVASIRHTKQVLPRTHERLTADRPDLIVHDAVTVLGSMLAAKLGLPSVSTFPNFAGNDKFDISTVLLPPDFDPQHPTFRQFVAEMHELAADFGVPVSSVTGAAQTADLNLVLIPREFQIQGEVFGPEFRFIGPSFGNREHEHDWQPPAGASKVLFVALGTVVNDRADFFGTVIKAFGGGDWHVAMAVGHQVDIAQLGEIPANFDVRPYFPQPEVLRHTDVFLSHSGMGSTMEAIMREVPIVSYPQIPEQAANGRRVQELGLGRLLDISRDVDPDELRHVVEEVAVDKEIRANLATMAGHVRDAGGPAAGADAIEELVR